MGRPALFPFWIVLICAATAYGVGSGWIQVNPPHHDGNFGRCAHETPIEPRLLDFDARRLATPINGTRAARNEGSAVILAAFQDDSEPEQPSTPAVAPLIPTPSSFHLVHPDGSEVQTLASGPYANTYLLSGGEIRFAIRAATGGSFDPSKSAVVLELGGGLRLPTGQISLSEDKKTWILSATIPKDGEYYVSARIRQTSGSLSESEPTVARRLILRTSGPTVEHVDAESLALGTRPFKIAITFNGNNPLNASAATNTSNYAITALSQVAAGGAQTLTVSTASYDARANMVILSVGDVPPGRYELAAKNKTADTDGIFDIFGNSLNSTPENLVGSPTTREFIRPVGTELPLVRPGLRGTTGPYATNPVFTPPRPSTVGFNPSDHVETRVSRLYYYRNAHRVAQIINRNSRSYNAAAVDMAQQLADKARTLADESTDARQFQERRAVQAAQFTREAEAELSTAQQAEREAQAQLAKQTVDVEGLRRRRDELQGQPVEELQPGAPETLPSPNEASTPQEELEKINRQLTGAEAVLSTVQALARQSRTRVENAQADVQIKRAAEIKESEKLQQFEAREQRHREGQFRREVAAGHADPDTYAPGKPDSIDPVEQVSISVIGEGLIQLRGPLKGINIIRIMINQIDAPVGQVRIGIHTVQINGEHEKRMERVATRIQDYIDHARFMTSQSTEMLRKAIVTVAARKADEVAAACLNHGEDFDEGVIPRGRTQDDRDVRYLYAFFGQDFVDELSSIDSEFLKTGNKILSLHSMDTTSLASALFVLSLAKNSTRMEILTEFHEMLQAELPMAEENFYEEGGFRGHFTRKFILLAPNARFQSFFGFFNTQVQGDDTMTPLQREFIRLAQIFKARLVTELELTQRIRERALIEERIGDPQERQRIMLDEERAAEKALGDAQKTRATAQGKALLAIRVLQSRIDGLRDDHASASRSVEASVEILSALPNEIERLYRTDIGKLVSNLRRDGKRLEADKLQQTYDNGMKNLFTPLQQGESIARRLSELSESLHGKLKDIVGEAIGSPEWPLTTTIQIDGTNVLLKVTKDGVLDVDEETAGFLREKLESAIASSRRAQLTLSQFRLPDQLAQEVAEVNRGLLGIDSKNNQNLLDSLFTVYLALRKQADVLNDVTDAMSNIKTRLDAIAIALSESNTDIPQLYAAWTAVEQELLDYAEGDLKEDARKMVGDATNSLRDLLETDLKHKLARRRADEARRPLDHKKFLDMFIDDMEDKYIELLEGTRAQTANIDNYIKRIITALDDDFNTQFYNPAFREVRKASRMWDVNLGQVETTTILANNREFAKVSPQATMEFDLPKREIVIQEAMKGAKAAVDDFGALVNDPSFLALAKLGSGQPTSTLAAGAAGGFGTVRNVLPPLSTSGAEDILSQEGPGDRELGAALESLIPDPAIYKFETGTGFEIRPVIQPDGQAVVFHFNYMYTTNVREPVRADEKHLGRVKRHFIDTDVQLSNFELREVSRYVVALKASRTSQGVPLLQDIPVVGALFRPLPSAESSLQENIILAQSTIFPTLFDLMGLRWAPAVADFDPLRLVNSDYLVRGRRRFLDNEVYDYASEQVDDHLRIPQERRRSDLYRTQETINPIHPNMYRGPAGFNQYPSTIKPNDNPQEPHLDKHYYPSERRQGPPYNPRDYIAPTPRLPGERFVVPGDISPESILPGAFPVEDAEEYNSLPLDTQLEELPQLNNGHPDPGESGAERPEGSMPDAPGAPPLELPNPAGGEARRDHGWSVVRVNAHSPLPSRGEQPTDVKQPTSQPQHFGRNPDDQRATKQKAGPISRFIKLLWPR